MAEKRQKKSRKARRENRQKLSKDIKEKFGNLFPNPKAVEAAFNNQFEGKYRSKVMNDFEKDPIATDTKKTGIYLSIVGRKVVDKLVDKLASTPYFKDHQISRKQLTTMVAAAYVADDWKTSLWSGIQKVAPLIMEHAPAIIKTVSNFLGIGQSEHSDLPSQMVESAANYASRIPIARSGILASTDIDHALRKALCAYVNPANYSAQIPRPSGEITYSVPNNYRIRIPVVTAASGVGSGSAIVTISPWAINNSAFGVVLNATTLDIGTGNNVSTGVLFPGPINTVTSSISTWNIISCSLHWEPTLSLLNQQGTVYMCLSPDASTSTWLTNGPSLSYFQNQVPDTSGPAVLQRDMLYLGDSTEQFTDIAFYGTSVLEQVAFLITGAPAGSVVGNIVVDTSYEVKVKTPAFGLIRPLPMPPSNRFAELVSMCEWSGLFQNINVRSQADADKLCEYILSPSFDLSNPQKF